MVYLTSMFVSSVKNSEEQLGRLNRQLNRVPPQVVRQHMPNSSSTVSHLELVTNCRTSLQCKKKKEKNRTPGQGVAAFGPWALGDPESQVSDPHAEQELSPTRKATQPRAAPNTLPTVPTQGTQRSIPYPAVRTYGDGAVREYQPTRPPSIVFY